MRPVVTNCPHSSPPRFLLINKDTDVKQLRQTVQATSGAFGYIWTPGVTSEHVATQVQFYCTIVSFCRKLITEFGCMCRAAG